MTDPTSSFTEEVQLNWIEGGGLLSARGFRAAGVHCGIKAAKLDLMVLDAGRPVPAAGAFTSNRVCAAPVMRLSTNSMRSSASSSFSLPNALISAGAAAAPSAIKPSVPCFAISSVAALRMRETSVLS